MSQKIESFIVGRVFMAHCPENKNGGYKILSNLDRVRDVLETKGCFKSIYLDVISCAYILEFDSNEESEEEQRLFFTEILNRAHWT